ncbi:hypothetical protein PsorP6_003234 [Peronosclerospora sorghi]|uniref:Uncharacterized protein n=1 Tax=Peronosclerospora sorghi TaxID=230839 RepID=A0ACC0VPJ6_9STRA|nr:hypothetical protein PsorP6_003234 [Peronosclerospora sorghi]
MKHYSHLCFVDFDVDAAKSLCSMLPAHLTESKSSAESGVPKAASSRDKKGRHARILPAHDRHDEVEHPMNRTLHRSSVNGSAKRNFTACEHPIRIWNARQRRPMKEV